MRLYWLARKIKIVYNKDAHTRSVMSAEKVCLKRSKTASSKFVCHSVEPFTWDLQLISFVIQACYHHVTNLQRSCFWDVSECYLYWYCLLLQRVIVSMEQLTHRLDSGCIAWWALLPHQNPLWHSCMTRLGTGGSKIV